MRKADVAITTGSTYQNAANLTSKQLARLKEQYEGTTRGRQELNGEILDDINGALWNREMLDKLRLRPGKDRLPLLRRIVVAIDPMVTDIGAKEMAKGIDKRAKARVGGSETGIIAAALGVDGHGYVLRDASLGASPLVWAQRAVEVSDELGADRIIAEKNNGGALVEVTIRQVRPSISYKAVYASRGKITRAEPVAALYEQGRVHHYGLFDLLEDQLVTYTGDPTQKSPDRLDALVWAITELMLGSGTFTDWVGPSGVEAEASYWTGGAEASRPIVLKS